MNDGYPFPEHTSHSSKKWKAISLILIIAIATETGLIASTYLSYDSKLSNLQTQYSSLQQQLQGSQGETQQLQQLIRSLLTANQSYTINVSQIFNLIKDSVVLIQTKTRVGLTLQDYAQGSGFVYDTSGIIITNNHVIDDAAAISVTFTSGNTVTAAVVGTDVYSDIAVLRIGASSEVLHPVVFGNSSALVVGEPILAIGNPYGLSGTVTSGIVSQVGRELSATGGYNIEDVIQIDAAINPGNSGGPLVNMLGEVVGMNTAIIEGSTGVGFAIASDTIKREMPSLIATGKYSHPYLGILGNDVSPDIAAAIGLNYTYGILVSDVTKNSPAASAGLRGGTSTVPIGGNSIKTGGDLIVEMNGLKIGSFSGLSVYLERYTKPGDTVSLTVIRSSQKISVIVTLGIRP